MSDDALALLAEALREPFAEWLEPDDVDEIAWDRKAEQVAATPSGARLLAALRDGLAVEALPKRYVIRVTWDPSEEDGPPAWLVQIAQGRYPGIGAPQRPWLVGEGPTLSDAVAAALEASS